MAGLEIDLETVFIKYSLIGRIRGQSGDNKIVCNSVSFLHFDFVTQSTPLQWVITRVISHFSPYFKSPFHWFLGRAKRRSLRQLFLFRDLFCKFGLAIFVSFVEKCTVWVSLAKCRRCINRIELGTNFFEWIEIRQITLSNYCILSLSFFSVYLT